MKNIIILLAISSILLLSGCATKKPMEFKDFSPRGITVTNIAKSERIQARLSAERHCAKYFKVARVLNSKAATESTTGSLVVECIKPNQ